LTEEAPVHQLTVQWNGEDVTLVVRCPYDPADPMRPCMAYLECGCQINGSALDELLRDGEAPCPQAPSGRRLHDSLGWVDGPVRPTRSCYLRVGEDAADALRELVDDVGLGTGQYPITFTYDDGGRIEVTATAS